MAISKKLRMEVYQKYNGKCGYTGKELPTDWQVDHKVSKSQCIIMQDISGLHCIENLIPCLRIVNHYKRALTLEQFRDRMLTFHKKYAKLPKEPYASQSIKRKKYMQEVADAFGITAENPFDGIFYFERIKNDKDSK